jgi:UV excision repair protein RAD23
MKLKFRTLKSTEYQIIVPDSSITVLELKKLIEQEQGSEADSIKLLYNGIILDDKKTLDIYSIKDNSVLMLMTSKIKKKNEELAPTDETTKEVKNESKIVKKLEKDEKLDKEEKNKESKEKTQKASSNQKPNNYSNQMTQLLEMGFEESHCLKAITAAKGSVQIAIEYLYNGIPSNISEVEPENIDIGELEEMDDISYHENQEHDHKEGEVAYLSPDLLDNFNLSDPNALSNIASIIKILISQDTSMLQDLIEEVGESNVEILEFIKENETQFKQLLSQPISEDDYKVFDKIVGSSARPEVNEVENDHSDENELLDEDNTLAEITKDFTDKDKESIKNLVSLGFSEIEAIQAYIACDKNEESAANFLFQDKK